MRKKDYWSAFFYDHMAQPKQGCMNKKHKFTVTYKNPQQQFDSWMQKEDKENL